MRQEKYMAGRVFITGATGTMGMATLREFEARGEAGRLTVLARNPRKNHKLLRRFEKYDGFRIVWGDLLDSDSLEEGIRDSEYILHFGGLVSPAADYNPEKTIEVNVGATRKIMEAIHRLGMEDMVKMVYIGSIAQCGDNRFPDQWIKAGDKLNPSVNDAYAYSKILGERNVVEGGLRYWVALRQTGILCPEIVKKGSDPITFHVPLEGFLEWTTAEDSARLMAGICSHGVPENFWRRFYNIGSGESYRLTNYEFEKMFLNTLSISSPEKVFGFDWFATDNFHGGWWADSDLLESIVPFRGKDTIDQYFINLKRRLPWYFKLVPLVPSALIKFGMRFIASKSPLGPLYWKKSNDERRLSIHFANSSNSCSSWNEWHERRAMREIPERGKRFPNESIVKDALQENMDGDNVKTSYLRHIASMRGGTVEIPDKEEYVSFYRPLEWRCAEGDCFRLSPTAVVGGGHWCPECLAKQCGF